MTTMANPAQFESWNGESGHRWVASADEHDRVLAPVAEALIAVAAPTPGASVLDIGCGCGATTLAAAAHVGSAGSATGIDLSRPMLDLALRRATAAPSRTATSAARHDGRESEVPMSSGRSPEATLARVYDDGAAAADQHWAPSLHRHARDLVSTIPPLAAGSWRTVVDVATGAGTLIPDLRRVAGSDRVVLALDRSLGMLRRGPADMPRIKADAARLPLVDGSADVVVLAFVLFMLPNARAAVAEAARVLRPGGRRLAATWGTQLETDADVVVREEIEAADPPPFPELPRSHELTDSPERMTSPLSEAGFADVRTLSRTLDAVFDPDSTLAMGTGFGKIGWRFARLDAPAQHAVRKRAADRLASLPAGAFVDRSEVLLTTARRH